MSPPAVQRSPVRGRPVAAGRSSRPPAMRLVFRALALALGLVVAVAPTRIAAQDVGSTVLVMVTSAETGEPLRGAAVEVGGTSLAAVTDADGRAILHRLASGTQEIGVRHLGYLSQTRPVTLEAGRGYSLAFSLQADPLPLEELRVKATRRMPSGAALGFHRRVERGIGNFITREEIERHRPRRFSDLLRMVPGLRLACDSFADICELQMRAAPPSMSNMDMRAARSSGADSSCPVQYYVDGVYQPYGNVNALRPDDLEAVEIYAHGHQAPARYSVRKNARCGVVLIWTRMTLAPARQP